MAYRPPQRRAADRRTDPDPAYEAGPRLDPGERPRTHPKIHPPITRRARLGL
jgi:hypothetical protein